MSRAPTAATWSSCASTSTHITRTPPPPPRCTPPPPPPPPPHTPPPPSLPPLDGVGIRWTNWSPSPWRPAADRPAIGRQHLVVLSGAEVAQGRRSTRQALGPGQAPAAKTFEDDLDIGGELLTPATSGGRRARPRPDLAGRPASRSPPCRLAWHIRPDHARLGLLDQRREPATSVGYDGRSRRRPAPARRNSSSISSVVRPRR